jgi:hypothetical protein
MPGPERGGSVNPLLEELVALERSALDRWIRLDPQGYLDAAAPEITYFDPTTERCVDGWEALQMRLAPMKTLKLPLKIIHSHWSYIRPEVKQQGS